ncbi:cholecystokinin receptor type A-like isoform X2 [Styela clava]
MMHVIQQSINGNFTDASTPAGIIAEKGYRCHGETMEIFSIDDYSGMGRTTTSIGQNVDTVTPLPNFDKLTSVEMSTTLLHITTPDFISNSSGFPKNEITNLVLYSIVLLLAVVGNALVIITLSANRRMRTVASCFLLSLSVSDLLLALICMPISLIGRIWKKFIFGRVMCKVMPLLMGMSVCVSTFTMLAISVERYYAICRPLRSRVWQTVSHAYKVIVAIWLLSFLLSLPYFILSDLRYIPLIDFGRCSIACRLLFPSSTARQAWYVFLLVILFCIPGILMTGAYTLISCKIWKEFQIKTKSIKGGAEDDHDTSDGLYITPKRSHVSFRSIRHSMRKLVTVSRSEEDTIAADKDANDFETTTTTLLNTENVITHTPRTLSKKSHSYGRKKQLNSGRKNVVERSESRSFRNAERLTAKKRVVRMLIVIVILFFLCWTPLFIVNVWKAFDPYTAMEKLDGIIEIIQLMSYVSTCVNPLVYCFMNSRFRAGFLRAFLFCIPGVQRKSDESIRVTR